MNDDLYGVLELEPSATPEEIKVAYYRLSKLHHPDLENGDTRKFQEIQAAYEVLSDPEKRLRYDRCEPLTALDDEAPLVEIIQMTLNDIASDCPDDLTEYVEDQYQQNVTAVNKNTEALREELQRLLDFTKRVTDSEKNSSLRNILKSKVRQIKQNIFVDKKKLEIYAKARLILLGLEVLPVPDPFDLSSHNDEVTRRVALLMKSQGFRSFTL